MSKTICAVLVSLLLGGCAQHAPLSRKEWIDTTTRTYSGVSKDQVLEATEKLFRLADGDDFIIVHTEDGVMASRQWLVYLVLTAVFGNDYWSVKAEQKGDTVKTTVQVNTQNQALNPILTTGGDFTGTVGPMAGSPVMGTAIYDIFWARLDYLLGKNKEWMTCEESNKKMKDATTWGTNESLCNSFNLKDNSPEIITAKKTAPNLEKMMDY